MHSVSVESTLPSVLLKNKSDKFCRFCLFSCLHRMLLYDYDVLFG